MLVALTIVVASVGADAQPKSGVFTLGILHSGQYGPSARMLFEQGLRDFGWVQGQNLTIEARSADGNLDRLPELASALVALKVDVIVAVAASETAAARHVTRTIPIVFVVHGDPVGTGDVQSLSRPGGN